MIPPTKRRHSSVLLQWLLAIQWILFLYLPATRSFMLIAPVKPKAARLFRSSNSLLHRLYYLNENQHTNPKNQPPNDNNNNKKKKQTPPSLISVPVIGPFLGQRLLLPGETMQIPTTPILSQSIAECLLRQKAMAAPWVAILEEETTTKSTTPTAIKGRYATLAAITGIGETTTTTMTKHQKQPNIREEKFLERLRSSPDVSIELMGIGRAIITGFHYEMRSDWEFDTEDDYKYYDVVQQHDEECDLDGDDERHECDLGARKHQILVGKFQILADENASRFRNASPVHALSNMASLANSINFLHQTRQQLVQKLRALQTRIDELEKLQDHDGLGLLFQDDTVREKQSLRKTTNRVQQTKNNFGLGSTATSMASIPALTIRTMDAIKPYYSPKKWSSEKFYYEMVSFTGVTTLRDCITPLDAAHAVLCSNTSDRLRLVHTWMHKHVLELQRMENNLRVQLKDDKGCS